MLQEVYGALESRDVVLHVVDVTRRLRLPEAKAEGDGNRPGRARRRGPRGTRSEEPTDHSSTRSTMKMLSFWTW